MKIEKEEILNFECWKIGKTRFLFLDKEKRKAELSLSALIEALKDKNIQLETCLWFSQDISPLINYLNSVDKKEIRKTLELIQDIIKATLF